jgi:hypothetical protein
MKDATQQRQLNQIDIVIEDCRAYCTSFEINKKGFMLEFEAINEVDKQKLRAIFNQEVKYK